MERNTSRILIRSQLQRIRVLIQIQRIQIVEELARTILITTITGIIIRDRLILIQGLEVDLLIVEDQDHHQVDHIIQGQAQAAEAEVEAADLAHQVHHLEEDNRNEKYNFFHTALHGGGHYSCPKRG